MSAHPTLPNTTGLQVRQTRSCSRLSQSLVEPDDVIRALVDLGVGSRTSQLRGLQNIFGNEDINFNLLYGRLRSDATPECLFSSMGINRATRDMVKNGINGTTRMLINDIIEHQKNREGLMLDHTYQPYWVVWGLLIYDYRLISLLGFENTSFEFKTDSDVTIIPTITDPIIDPNIRVESIDLSLSENLKYVGNCVFFRSGARDVTQLDLSKNEKLETIGELAFHCLQLGKDKSKNEMDSLKLPASIKSIGRMAFLAADLRVLDISNCVNLAEIGESCFESCQLTDLHLPVSVKNIGERAFAWSSLKSLDMSHCTSLIKIGKQAFCHSLLDDELGLLLPPSVVEIDDGAFQRARLKILDMSNLTKCKKIGEMAFLESKFTRLVLPGSLVDIGASAFLSAEPTRNLYTPGENELALALVSDLKEADLIDYHEDTPDKAFWEYWSSDEYSSGDEYTQSKAEDF